MPFLCISVYEWLIKTSWCHSKVEPWTSRLVDRHLTDRATGRCSLTHIVVHIFSFIDCGNLLYIVSCHTAATLAQFAYGWVSIGTQSSICKFNKKQLKYYCFLGLYAWNFSHYTICFQRVSGVSFQIVLFISKCMKWAAQICNLIYLYTELYQRKLFD